MRSPSPAPLPPGEREYLINKVACRLRDVTELFLDTGVGCDAYSIIGQGEIDAVLSIRSEDRRALVEGGRDQKLPGAQARRHAQAGGDPG